MLHFQVSLYYDQILIYYGGFSGKTKLSKIINKWNNIPISVFYLNVIILLDKCDGQVMALPVSDAWVEQSQLIFDFQM